MKIAFVCNDITTRGGIERVTSNLASVFVERGNEVTIISLYQENKNPSFPTHKDVKIVYLNNFSYLNTKKYLKMGMYFMRTTKLLKNCYKQNKYDVLIAQATRATIHCVLGNLTSKTIPCEHFKYGLYRGYKLRLRNWLYKKFNCVAVLTPKDNEKFQSIGVSSVYIPNMAPMTTGESIPCGISNTIVSLGRLHPQKGFDLLLEAIPNVIDKYPDWKFEIYGEGSEKENLEKLILSKNLSNHVSLKGFTTNLRQAFSGAAFYVMSSRYEGFPMCLLEAASYKLPIISFNCPEGPAELLKNNAGLLIAPENIDKLSEGIIYMIEHPNERAKMANNASENLKEYLPDNIYMKWANAFKCITERR